MPNEYTTLKVKKDSRKWRLIEEKLRSINERIMFNLSWKTLVGLKLNILSLGIRIILISLKGD